MPSPFQHYQYTAIPNPEKQPKGSKGILAAIIVLVVVACFVSVPSLRLSPGTPPPRTCLP